MRLLSLAALGLGVGVALASMPSGARADTIYTLVTAGTLPSGTYGTVDVSSVDANTLKFDVELSGTNHFANTGIQAAFAFDLTGFSSITVGPLPSIWSAENTTAGVTTAGSIHMDGAGFFDYGLTFNN